MSQHPHYKVPFSQNLMIFSVLSYDQIFYFVVFINYLQYLLVGLVVHFLGFQSKVSGSDIRSLTCNPLNKTTLLLNLLNLLYQISVTHVPLLLLGSDSVSGIGSPS